MTRYSAWSDLRGGIQLAWVETPSTYEQLFVQRLGPDGNPAPGWGPCGVLGHTAAQSSGSCYTQEYGHHAVAPAWPDGVIASTWSQLTCLYGPHPCQSCLPRETWLLRAVTAGGPSDPTPVVSTPGAGTIDPECGYLSTQPDGAGGFLTFSACDRVHRFGAYGNPSWEFAADYPPQLSPDGRGDFDAFRASSDYRPRVSKILNDGTWSPVFGPEGVRICESPCFGEDACSRVPDGDGGVFLVWRDGRETGSYPFVGDLYATWIRGDGMRGAGWRPDGDPIVVTPGLEDLSVLVSSRRGAAIAGWRDRRAGDWNLYAFRLTSLAPEAAARKPGRAAPLRADADKRPAFRIDAVRPNPAAGEIAVEFVLGRAGDVSARVLDVAGRTVANEEWCGLGPGSHAPTLAAARRLAPGVYVIELRAEGLRERRKVVVTR